MLTSSLLARDVSNRSCDSVVCCLPRCIRGARACVVGCGSCRVANGACVLSTLGAMALCGCVLRLVDFVHDFGHQLPSLGAVGVPHSLPSCRVIGTVVVVQHASFPRLLAVPVFGGSAKPLRPVAAHDVFCPCKFWKPGLCVTQVDLGRGAVVQQILGGC